MRCAHAEDDADDGETEWRDHIWCIFAGHDDVMLSFSSNRLSTVTKEWMSPAKAE
jgi:hypothetical protein